MSVAAPSCAAAERVATDVCGRTIFLDFQATTPLDPRVLEAMLPWLKGAHNAHAVEHRPGRAAARAVDDARERVATLLGCRPPQITFTSGATEASNVVLRGLTAAGDGLAISAIEHASVMATADALQTQGRSVSRIRVSEDGVLDLDALEEALTVPTRLVSIMAVNNEIGTVQPLEEAAGLCAERGAPLHSDVTQAVGRVPVRLGDSPVAYASMSAHKIYGPQGVGALFIGDGAAVPRPLATGGAQENGLRPGTLPVANCVGFGVACELAVTQRQRDFEHATRLRRTMLEGLSSLDGWQVNGSLEERVPHNLSIAFDGMDADVLLESLPDLALATGSACSGGALKESETLKAIGLPRNLAEGTVRIGFGRTTTVDEVRTAAALIRERVELFRRAP